ncbi:MAG: EpsI family protein [bacterium]|nr:EpsI family protein [bacterium]
MNKFAAVLQELSRVYHCRGAILSICLLMVVPLVRVTLERGAVDVPSIPLAEIPYEISGWVGEDTSALAVSEEQTLKLDKYIRRNYRRDNQSVFAYMGFWKHQTGDHQAAKHSPALCLPANGWKIIEAGKVVLPLSESVSVTANSILAEKNGSLNLFYYWFYAGNEFYAEEWQSLMRISFSNLVAGRSDGGIIEFGAPVANPAHGRKQAEASLKSFLADFSGYLLDYTVRFDEKSSAEH